MSHKHQMTVLLCIQALLVIGIGIATGFKLVPVGVPGEWEWNRLPDSAGLSWDGITIAVLGVAIYSGLGALGLRLLREPRSRAFECVCVAGLVFASVCVQVVVPMGAPAGYDLTKWASVNYLSASAGYFQIARDKAASDPWKFLAEYPDWIRTQDVLHIGTHPPGLILAQCLLLRTMEQNPRLTSMLSDHMPASVDAGFRVFADPKSKPLSRAERASLYATALLTLLACAGTVVPLYLLARAFMPASASWAAAALWPLVPSANLFQPVADTAYPLLATSAFTLAAWASRMQQNASRQNPAPALLAAASGIVMAFGMSFTLAFLPVGLIVFLTLIGTSTASLWRQRSVLVLATGAGFLAVLFSGWALTAANPFVIGSWNIKHHAQFYVEYPRTYLLWLWLNPLETTIALGVPSACWCLAGFLAPRTVPLPAWSTLSVLILIDLIGRNMGEVARLWMLFMPSLLVAAGAGMNRLGARPSDLGISIGLLGAQTLALQALIQVVYPV
jgi:hypothetical protein